MVERIPTGIEGLDPLIEGGFPAHRVILVKGYPGTFKTIFGLQYLYAGAMRNETGLYITFSQPINKLYSQAYQFGWNFERLPKTKFMQFDVIKQVDLEDKVLDTISAFRSKRVVIDSLTSYIHKLPLEGPLKLDELRQAIEKVAVQRVSEDIVQRCTSLRLFQRLRESGCTALCILEEKAADGRAPYEYLADGVITLGKIEALRKRSISIEKMRATKHVFETASIELSPKGLRVISK